MIPQRESKEVRVLRQYIDENANLNLTVKKQDVEIEDRDALIQDKDAEIAELRRSNQELQAQLDERNASETEA